MAFSLTKREHPIGNLTAALLLDDMGIMFDRLLGWLLKGVVVSRKLCLYHCRRRFLVVEYSSQTIFRLQI
jgi:hypothetical protein